MWRITLKPLIIFICSVICALYLWGYNYPATAKKIASQLLTSECKTDITWVKQGDNHWQSETGITLKFYRDPRFKEVPSMQFWDGKWTPGSGNPLQNLTEAYALLSEATVVKEIEEPSPGKEIEVTQQFRRVVNPWKMRHLPPSDPNQPFFIPNGIDYDYQSSPYRVHYLQRHADTWVIDRLFVHAQGVFNRKLEMERIYVTERGPFLPIFEGRFKQSSRPQIQDSSPQFPQADGITFWFSTYNPAVHRGLSDSDMQSRESSTPEMRLATWQAINNFFETCIKADE